MFYRSLRNLLVVLVMPATAIAQTTPEGQGTQGTGAEWGAAATTDTGATATATTTTTTTETSTATTSDAPLTDVSSTDSGGVDFLLSARLPAPWMVLTGDEDFSLWSLVAPTALPRFVAGAQIGKLGVGAGFNYGHIGISGEAEGEDTGSTSMGLFLLGPTVSYQLLESASKRVQLHAQAAFMIGTGGVTVEESGEDDIETGIFCFGFDVGAFGRAIIIDGFAFDAGISFDLVSFQTSMDAIDASQSTTILEFLGFIGATFLI